MKTWKERRDDAAYEFDGASWYGRPGIDYFKTGADFGYEEALKDMGPAIEALVWCDEMLTARDEMNSKVHCAPVRLSPITERVKQALALFDIRKAETKE
jgi:hypothetical protein